ncbi:MAG: GNAT family N-acetyltransferase [Sphingomonas sp.]|uniref:GNAT family N-acetyltransferase n=1 Tax=Sphingomonas sp. TaxID=28214 RepID=UPI00179697B1|nr:GNAT family N-acetyltransferase [Sphingomonas sp.]MBA3667480.1 GNAT family N-acetyltransferase [Sphingomonas sp.]
MTIAIHRAEPGDIQTIIRLVRELAEYEREPDSAKATPNDIEAALFGSRAVAEAVIARVEGKPVGMAVFFQNFSTWTGRSGIYLEDLYVTPDARGGGVGSALLRHLASIAVKRGCARFEWAVLDWNQPAIDFYISKGAECMKEWRIYRVAGDALTELAGA